jgi:hypothetical protein
MKMKKIVIPLIAIISMSSCIVEVDMTPANVVVGEINEYETKEVIREVWSGNNLVYEEYIYHTFLEIEFLNTGGFTARNIWAEVSFYDGGRFIKTININLPKIYAGETYIYELNTGFNSPDLSHSNLVRS